MPKAMYLSYTIKLSDAFLWSSKNTALGRVAPCVDAAPWMAGVNDGGQSDPWDKKVYGLPNIGADQGPGMPITGIRVSGFSKHFR